jgi:hypothetical protein
MTHHEQGQQDLFKIVKSSWRIVSITYEQKNNNQQLIHEMVVLAAFAIFYGFIHRLPENQDKLH